MPQNSLAGNISFCSVSFYNRGNGEFFVVVMAQRGAIPMSDSSVINNPQAEQNLSTAAAGDRTPHEGVATASTRPWLRFYEQGVPAQLAIPDYPLTWLLDQAVSRYP